MLSERKLLEILKQKKNSLNKNRTPNNTYTACRSFVVKLKIMFHNLIFLKVEKLVIIMRLAA
jgi:hypothetical protein